MNTYRVWILENFTFFRQLLFFNCLGYWVIGYFWFKPKHIELRAAIMAVWVQMALGTPFDALIVKQNYWIYRAMGFSIYGVPLDLHLNWGLIWGFFLVWCYSKLLRFWRGWKFVLVYLTIWTLVTLAFDSIMAQHLLFLQTFSSNWWVADALFLFTVQGATLWVYQAILFPLKSRSWEVWSCRLRSVLYVGGLMYVFYVSLPNVILTLTKGWGVKAWFGLENVWVLVAFLLLPVSLGTWATWEFTGVGLGTPLPLDPPRRLVTTGPYAYVRNPMQLSGVLMALVLAFRYPTIYMFAYVLDMILVSVVLFSLFERGELDTLFGSEFQIYKQKVRNWLPVLPKK